MLLEKAWWISSTRSESRIMPDCLSRSVAAVLVLVVITVACSSDSELGPFTSDGCSLFPDSSVITKDDWCSCCFVHDIAYWQGGTYDEREAADASLRKCVLDKTGNGTLAKLMYEGVRLGGSPYFYNWYRWGYGWDYDRKYQALTNDERKLAGKLVEEYFDTVEKPACPI